MRRGRATFALLAAAAALAGCGSDEEGEPIPQASVAEIAGQLDNIEGQLTQGSVGACNDIRRPNSTYDALVTAVENVPDSVDADVRDALEQSVSRLGDLVDEECSSREAEETETVPEETETITVETVPEEQPTETVETVPPPAEEDQGDGESLPPGQQKKLDSEGGTPGGGSEPGGGTGGGGLPAPGGEE
jgi:hypothetical protein